MGLHLQDYVLGVVACFFKCQKKRGSQLVNNFTVIESVYGKFLLNRHCYFQAEALIKTGKTHIEAELENIFVIVDKLSEGCVIVDGGANAGFFTVPVAQRIKNKNGLVVAFEPQREIFNGLAGTIALNDLENVRVNRMALGPSSSTAKLPVIDYSVVQDFGAVSLILDHNPLNLYDKLVEQLRVESIALDDLCLHRLDFLKLDVEGFELLALQGSRRTLEMFRPFVWIEYWKIGSQNLINELKYLDEYDSRIVDELNMLFSPMEKIKEFEISFC